VKKAIVTGANGFIGQAVIKELLKNNVEVIAILRKEENKKFIQNKHVHAIVCDLENINDLTKNMKIENADVFYHFAWDGSAGEKRADTKLQLKNVQWTIDSIETAKELKCKKFVCAGSIMEQETIAAAYKYGNKPGMGYIYGSSKMAAHSMGKSIAVNIGIDFIWAEITNAYGVGEVSARFINTTIRKILNDEPLQFTSAIQNYDFIYISDVARAFYLIGEKGKAFGEYVIGSSSAQPLKNFILEMKDTLAPDKEFIFGDIPFTGINLEIKAFSTKKLEEDTGFRPEVSFCDGIKKTSDWLKEQEVK